MLHQRVWYVLQEIYIVVEEKTWNKIPEAN